MVTRTEQGDVTDAEATAGRGAVYSVFAARGGDAWSAPAGTPPVVFTPEVAEVCVGRATNRWPLSWRPTPAPKRSSWSGRGPPAPGTGTTARPCMRRWPASRTTGLRTGAEYFYRIVACLPARRAGSAASRPDRGAASGARARARPWLDLDVPGQTRTGPWCGPPGHRPLRPGPAGLQRQATAMAGRDAADGRTRPPGSLEIPGVPRAGSGRSGRPGAQPASGPASPDRPDRGPQRLGGRCQPPRSG